jgi:hypothetical protein
MYTASKYTYVTIKNIYNNNDIMKLQMNSFFEIVYVQIKNTFNISSL